MMRLAKLCSGADNRSNAKFQMLNPNIIRLDIPLGRGVMGCNAKFRRINLKVLSTDAFCLDSAQIRLPHLKICIEELRLKTKETFMRDGNQDCIFLPNYPTFKKQIEILKMSFPVLREPVKYCLADFFSKGGG